MSRIKTIETKDIAKTVNNVVYELTPHTAGGRLRFSTDSKTLKIVAKWDVKLNMPHMPSLGSSGFTLYEDLPDGSSRFLKSFIPKQLKQLDRYTFTKYMKKTD